MSSNNPFFSVIIPCYNCAKYLPECLNSLITQDYTQWEAIVVNDASTDNSYDVASRFATQDNRIRLLNKEKNEGLHLARKSGTALSAGKYVLFLDSDDAFAKGTLNKIHSTIQKELPDILRFGLICREQKGMSSRAARDFEAWANVDSPVSDQEQLLSDVFISANEYGRDWHVTHLLMS